MARKRTGKPVSASSAPRRRAAGSADDTVMRSLSKEEVRRLAIDAWEPSLLRNLLEAENKLRRR